MAVDSSGGSEMRRKMISDRAVGWSGDDRGRRFYPICSNTGVIGMSDELDDLLNELDDELLNEVARKFVEQPLGGPRKHEPDGYDGGTMCYRCDPPHSILYGGGSEGDQREDSHDGGQA